VLDEIERDIGPRRCSSRTIALRFARRIVSLRWPGRGMAARADAGRSRAAYVIASYKLSSASMASGTTEAGDSMPVGALVAGVDSSTQATKVVVVDPDSGGWWHRVRPATPSPAPAALGIGSARVVVGPARRSRRDRSSREIGAISIAGQQHGLVALDGHGEPLCAASLWNDTRAAADAERLTERLGAQAWARLTGLRPVASFTVCKWAWLRRTAPDLARSVEAVRLPHDYLTERLTGHGTTDRGDASGTGWWSPSTGGYLDEILGLPEVDLPPERLPAIVAPTDPAGQVSVSAGHELGLAPGTIVGPGTGDNMGPHWAWGCRLDRRR
jgi:xylulokinase